MRALSIVQILGKLLILLSFIFWLPGILAYLEGEDYLAFLEAFVATVLIGLIFVISTRGNDFFFSPKEGFATVFFSWILLSIFGSLPYLLTDTIQNLSFADAFFETASGFTTTGSSVLQHIEEMPKSLLFWRSLTQWIGGMGIIVLFLAILPVLGAGGFQLFRAEIPGPNKDKLSPKIKSTASVLWVIYLGLSLTLFALLYVSGEMDIFDAVCHTFTTVSTGGFSTRDASIQSFDSWKVEALLSSFMLISSCNFGLIILMTKGNFSKVIQNEELKLFITLIFGVIVISATLLHFNENTGFTWLHSFRVTSFQVITLISSTGFSTCDYNLWPLACQILILYIMILGGCAGSTSGGLKIFRLWVILKVAQKQVKQVIHPRGFFNVKIDGLRIEESLLRIILGFILIFFSLILFSVLVLSVLEGGKFSLVSIVSVCISCMSNIGPGMAEFGPSENFYKFSEFSKTWLSFLMIFGRLEIFSALVLFHPMFWRK